MEHQILTRTLQVGMSQMLRIFKKCLVALSHFYNHPLHKLLTVIFQVGQFPVEQISRVFLGMLQALIAIYQVGI